MRLKPVVMIAVLLPLAASGQNQLFVPFSHERYNAWERILGPQSSFHTSVKPFRRGDFLLYGSPDTAYAFIANQFARTNFRRKVIYRLMRENLVKVDAGDFHLTIDPLFNWEYIRAFEPGDNHYTNTRGFLAEGGVGEKFSFSSSFRENQAEFPRYLDRLISDSLGVIPGQGRVRNFKGTGAHDYASSEAYISFSPSSYFNFQFGHGKNFFGDGYRSLLLSDNSFSYPFLKVTTDVWKIKYVNLWTEFLDLSAKSVFGLGYARKYGSFHYLSLNAAKGLQVGLFEGIIWKSSDTLGHRGLDVNYFNPVIFFRPVEFSLGSPDNALMGLNLKYALFGKVILYGQLVLDDFYFDEFKKNNGWYGQKYGLQGGYKIYDLFDVEHLCVRFEHNLVQPYTFGHKAVMQNYSHYGQPLAHPLGANFRETTAILSYRLGRWSFGYKGVYAVYGADSTGTHNGQNIFVSDYQVPDLFSNKLLQGIKTEMRYNEFRVNYLVNPLTMMEIELKAAVRGLSSAITGQTDGFITFGFRTGISNINYDF